MIKRLVGTSVAATAMLVSGCGYRGPVGAYYFDPSGEPIPESATCTIVTSLADVPLVTNVAAVLATTLRPKGLVVQPLGTAPAESWLTIRLTDAPSSDPRLPFVDGKALPPDRCFHATLSNTEGVELWSAHIYGARYNEADWQEFVTRHLAEGLKEL